MSDLTNVELVANVLDIEGSVELQAVELQVIGTLDTDAAHVVETVQGVVTIERNDEPMQVLTVAEQGPAGPPGTNEDEMTYAKRVDIVSDNLLYRGEAVVGATDDAPVWRIRRITIAIDGDIREEWVDGAASFAHVWNDRSGYAYL